MMIIPCNRCGKEIDTPNEHNSDYVLSPDFIVDEERDVLVAFRHNQETLDKKEAGLEIDDNEYEQVEVDPANIQDAHSDSMLEKMLPMRKLIAIQKSAIICPDCYQLYDTVIWGVHKKVAADMK